MFFFIGIVLYAIGRATQQSSIFNFKNREANQDFIDEAQEIHAWGYLEPLGLIIATTAITYTAITKSFHYLWAWGLAYFIYFYPYALLYCKLRNKDWFDNNQIYVAKLWKITIRTKLISEKYAMLLCVIASLTSIFILK